MAHVEDPFIPESIPEVLGMVIEQAGWYIPDEGYPTPAIAEIYGRSHRGCCILCEREFGEDTILCMDSTGLQVGFCCNPCMQDFEVMNWLMTVYDDMATAVRFRAQGVESVEEAAGVEEDPRKEEVESEEEEGDGEQGTPGKDTEGEGGAGQGETA